MNKNYYYLISSLPLLRLDDYKGPYRVNDFVLGLYEHLSAEHVECVRNILAIYDNPNIVDVALGLAEPISDKKGNWPFAQIKKSLPEEDNQFDDYINDFNQDLLQRRKEQDNFTRQETEELLFSKFYAKMIRHENQFIRHYFKFDLDLRNILTALNKRKFSLENINFIELTDDDALVYKLRTSSLGEFGLSRDIDYISDLIENFDKRDIVYAEKYIDQLRWKKIDQINTFMYFEVDIILGYLIKLMLVERWIDLEVSKGREVFAQRTKLDTLEVYQ